MISNSKVNLCVDALLVETVLADPKFYKKAGFVQDLLGKIKDYFGAHIDKENPVSSVLNILAPGALWLLFNSLGIGKWGFLLGLLMDVFHVDVGGMLQSLYEKVRDMIGGGKKATSAQIDAAAKSTAQEYNTPGTKEEAQQGYQALQQKQVPGEGSSDDGKVYSSLELMHDAKIISLALIEYENQNLRLTKEAIGLPSFLGGYSSTKSKGTSLLSTIFGFIIKLALASAGLMVAGDVANELMGNKTPLSGGSGQQQQAPQAPPTPRSTQTKFPAKGDGPLPSSWPLVNNQSNIENMVIQFAKQTYSGLDDKDSLIRNAPGFRAVVDTIAWYNIHNKGTAMIFIPGNFTTRKQIVDFFIDDVAKASG
jgi:hypothetical protein